jgi:predicted transcriptional regulator
MHKPLFPRVTYISVGDWTFPDMKFHFSNYISKRDAEECQRREVREISLTPTALKQTPKKTLEFLKDKGVKIEVCGSRGRPRKLSLGRVKRILAMRQRGLSYYRIARLSGVPKSTVFDYCRRHWGITLSEEEVNRQELIEAKNFLRRLQRAGLGEELTALAREGCTAKRPEEIAYILGEIEKVVEAYR